MGWVPPGPPARPPGMTDDEYGESLRRHSEMIGRIAARYRASVGPWMVAAAIMLPVFVVLAVIRWVGM